MKKSLLIAAVFASFLTSASIAQNQVKTFQFTFINHIDAQLNFSVDDVYACTANPGMVCYSTVAVGEHTFKAMKGSTVIREVTATLYENADSPSWTICYTENGGGC